MNTALESQPMSSGQLPFDRVAANGCGRLGNDLPPEVLGEIYKAFVTFSPGKRLTWEIGKVCSTSTGDSPMVLGQVCTYWRSVALGMPTLWSSMYVEYPTSYHVDLVRLWLDRAGSCPLTLVFRDFLDSDPEHSEATSIILRLFAERSTFWKKIDFAIGLRDSSLADCLQYGSCPNLESASVLAFNWGAEAIDKLWTKLHRSPVLRVVDWHDAFKRGASTHVPWSQLQKIRMSNPISDMEVFFILQACPDLLVFDIHYIPLPFTPPSALNIHDSLVSFILTVEGDSTPLFNNLSLPALEVLHIRNECPATSPNVDEWIGMPIQRCLKRSRCTLRDLRVLDFDDDYVDLLLEHLLYVPVTKNLEEFEVDFDQYNGRVLDILAEHPSYCIRDLARATTASVQRSISNSIQRTCQRLDSMKAPSTPGEQPFLSGNNIQSRLALLHLYD